MAYDFSEHDYKEDCYWYDAVQDMGANIPICLKQGIWILGSCPCNECKDYITHAKIQKMLRTHCCCDDKDVKDIKDGEAE